MFEQAYQRGIDAALEKFAARINAIHGTSGRWDVLRPGVGKAIAANDPNPRAVYFGTSNRRILPHISEFANNAVKKRGGEPVVARAKLDSNKGWEPRTLTAWGQKNVGSIDDMLDLWYSLDGVKDKAQRGPMWEKVQRGVGSWVNQEPSTTVTPIKYLSVPRKPQP